LTLIYYIFFYDESQTKNSFSFIIYLLPLIVPSKHNLHKIV